jgi:hypothetical protein
MFPGDFKCPLFLSQFCGHGLKTVPHFDRFFAKFRGQGTCTNKNKVLNMQLIEGIMLRRVAIMRLAFNVATIIASPLL